MPTNVSIEYIKAKEKFEKAKTQAEKMIALQEMQRTVPKHKGTEKLRAELSKKVAQIRKQMEKERIQAKKASRASLHIRKEGCGQIVLVSLPNAGKSFLLKKLTNAEVEVKNYPFTTITPVQGMMNFNGALVQLVEVPALVEGSSEGKANGIQMLSIIRNADGIVLVVESFDALNQLKILLNELRKANILVNEKKPKIEIKKSDFPGLSIAGEKYLRVSKEELREFLKGYGLGNANIVLKEETDFKKVARVLDERIVYKKAIVVVTKCVEEKKIDFSSMGKEFEVECFDEKKLNELKKKIFSVLEKILIYTKKPGGKPDLNEPIVVKRDSSVAEVARKLHKEFAQNLRFVRVWGSAKFPGQRVGKNFKLKDRDVIEIFS